MKKIRPIRLICLGVIISLLAACSTKPRVAAPVVARTTLPARAGVGKPATTVARPEASAYYTVKKGDTLYRIALESGQGYQDIVEWNNLANPNDIKVDQVLRVAPPVSASTSATTPASTPVPASVQTGAVQTGAVPGAASAIEIKPLGASTSANHGVAAPVAIGNNKIGPRGDRRAYSESALAELERPDTATASTPAKAGEPAQPAGKPAVEASASDDEMVSWMWPTEGDVVATFEAGRKGLDIAGKSGQPVLAAGAGKIMYAGSSIRSYGNLVIVRHTGNLLSAYAHNKTILVKEGQAVSKGQKIAEMGDSDSDSVRLHFEIRQQGKPVDPLKYLPPR